MEKVLKINSGNAFLLNESSEILSRYDAVNINTGNAIISRKVYDRLTDMGIVINCGKIKILDIAGEIVELTSGTIITGSMSYEGCFLVCDGNLIIEDASCLTGITGLYANNLFYNDSIDLSGFKGIEVSKRTIYPVGAKLYLGNMTIEETSAITLEADSLYWVNGNIKALDSLSLEKLHSKNLMFNCNRLIILSSLYEKYSSMFSSESYLFIPDDHTVVEDISLDAATAILYGDRLFVLHDLMIAHDQIQNLKDFTSIIVNKTVTMPMSAASKFKAIGKANSYELYDGVFMPINGVKTIGHEQCQTAIKKGITYTLKGNGVLLFMSDVEEEDMDAIAAIYHNGVISAPDAVRGILDSKIKEINGTVIDIDTLIEQYYGGDSNKTDNPIDIIQKVINIANGDVDGSTVNTQNFKL